MSHDYDDLELKTQCEFHNFCNTVIRNAAINALKKKLQRMDKEVYIVDLSRDVLYRFCAYEDSYDEDLIYAEGKVFTIDMLKEALDSLPDDKRIVIVRYYYERKTIVKLQKN